MKYEVLQASVVIVMISVVWNKQLIKHVRLETSIRLNMMSEGAWEVWSVGIAPSESGQVPAKSVRLEVEASNLKLEILIRRVFQLNSEFQLNTTFESYTTGHFWTLHVIPQWF